MFHKEKYKGIIPAFYACYDSRGEVSPATVRALTRRLVQKGVQGLYLCGSSGECIYQSVAERKLVLESVMEEGGGALTVIAHVACNNTRDSAELARHAEEIGVDAIAAIPPIYFHLPEYSIAAYWNAISAAAPKTDFMIYNIPQLAGVALTGSLFQTMLANPRVKAVKNSSMPIQDIQLFKAAGGEGFVVFNGPDEQLVGGLAMGADGGIGGTYGVMPEVYLAIERLVRSGRMEPACRLQYAANEIIGAMCACHGNMYAVIKEILLCREGLDIGSVRAPLSPLDEGDMPAVARCISLIDAAVAAAGQYLSD